MVGSEFIPSSRSLLIDNLVFMRNCKDKEFDVAVVDPEYLDKNQPNQFMRAKGGMINWKGAPKEEYFYHLFRISSEQIIFGGNYFTNVLDWSKFDTQGRDSVKPFLKSNGNWIIWDKRIAFGMNYSMYEAAWTSIKKVGKIYKLSPVNQCSDWHSTSKPVSLYEFVFKNYINPIREELDRNLSIIDTNLGSGGIRKVAYALGYKFTGLEINPIYWEKEKLEFDAYKRQHSIFQQIEEEFEPLDFWV